MKTVRRLAVAYAVIAATACTSPPPTPTYLQISPTGAVVRDSLQNLESGKANICSLVALNGRSVESSFDTTAQATAGRGFQLLPRVAQRPIEPGTHRAEIECATVFASPIQSMFGRGVAVRGTVSFTAVNGAVYVVRGNLDESSELAVWIENQAGTAVTEKITAIRP